MTVQYYEHVLTGGPVVFFRLLAKWRGCVFKLIYLDLIVFLISYGILSVVYRFGMGEPAQRQFEHVIHHVYKFQSLIPVAFILGFYVTLVFARFWRHFLIIPWAVRISMMLAGYLHGTQEHVRLMRRTVVRYLNAGLVLTTIRLHVSAKKRFPTSQHIVDAGILTKNEMDIIENINPQHCQPYIPIAWATAIITRAEKERLIINHHALVNMINEVNNFRQGLLNLFMWDYVCVPLVYTQVVTLSVYSYFVACVVGRQFIVAESPLVAKEDTDMIIPIFTILEFIVYMGWLKVAETLVNPMGEDDEDFDVNEIIDYNWKVSLSLVDGMKFEPPDIVRDAHWDTAVVELPHTEMSKKFAVKPYMGSVYNIHLPGSVSDVGSLRSVSVIPGEVEVAGSHGDESLIPAGGADLSGSVGSGISSIKSRDTPDSEMRPVSRSGSSGSGKKIPGGLRPVKRSGSVAGQTTSSIREVIQEVEEVELEDMKPEMDQVFENTEDDIPEELPESSWQEGDASRNDDDGDTPLLARQRTHTYS